MEKNEPGQKAATIDDIRSGRVEPDPDMLNSWYQFLKDMGLGYAIKDLKRDAKRREILHIFRTVIIDNDASLPTADAMAVTIKFMSHMMYKSELINRSVKGLVGAYREWMRIIDVEETLGVRRNILPAPDPDRGRVLLPVLEMWPDEEIQRTAAIIRALGYPFEYGRPDSYWRKVGREIEKRGLTIPEIDLGRPGPLAPYMGPGR